MVPLEVDPENGRLSSRRRALPQPWRGTDVKPPSQTGSDRVSFRIWMGDRVGVRFEFEIHLAQEARRGSGTG